MTRQIPIGQTLWRICGAFRKWDLWHHTSRWGVAWILTCEIAITTWAGLAGHRADAPTAAEWLVFAGLSAAAAAHIAGTWPTETRHRAAHVHGEHIDHTGIHTVAAALVLPIPLLVALVIAIRLARYPIARKPPNRMIFSTSAHLASAIAAHIIAASTPLADWLTGSSPRPTGPSQITHNIIALAAAVLVYYLAQTIIIGIARGLASTWSWKATIGTSKENWEFGVVAAMGVLTAYTSTEGGGILLAAGTIVAIAWTRSSQGEVDGLHDPLTGLPNRRAFLPVADTILKDDAKIERTTAFAVIDLDFFKKINDTYGHGAGDAVLVATSAHLRDHIRRGHDTICRWGGEEFVIVLAATTAEEATLIMDRARAQITALTITYLTAAGGKPRTIDTTITISVGIALAPRHGDNLDALYASADKALYAAKEAGRNQVQLAPHSDPALTHRPDEVATLRSTEDVTAPIR